MSYTTIRANDDALSRALKKRHYQEVVAILVANDKELCDKYLKDSDCKLYFVTDEVSHKDLAAILNIQDSQVNLIISQYMILSLVEMIIMSKKEAGRPFQEYKIIKENGDIFSKELFDKHINLKSHQCTSALLKAKNYFSTKVD
jgi:predicted transcriptional regulator